MLISCIYVSAEEPSPSADANYPSLSETAAGEQTEAPAQPSEAGEDLGESETDALPVLEDAQQSAPDQAAQPDSQEVNGAEDAAENNEASADAENSEASEVNQAETPETETDAEPDAEDAGTETENGDEAQPEGEQPQDAQSDAEETGAETEEADEQAIDCNKSCRENLQFSSGYVMLDAAAALYEGAYSESPVATVSRGAAYALSRPNAGGRTDRLQVAFAAENEIKTLYVNANQARPMSEAEIGDYLAAFETLEDSAKYYYIKGENRFALMQLSFAPVSAQEQADELQPDENTEGADPAADGDQQPMDNAPETQTGEAGDGKNTPADDTVTDPAESGADAQPDQPANENAQEPADQTGSEPATTETDGETEDPEPQDGAQGADAAQQNEANPSEDTSDATDAQNGETQNNDGAADGEGNTAPDETASENGAADDGEATEGDGVTEPDASVEGTDDTQGDETPEDGATTETDEVTGEPADGERTDETADDTTEPEGTTEPDDTAEPDAAAEDAPALTEAEGELLFSEQVSAEAMMSGEGAAVRIVFDDFGDKIGIGDALEVSAWVVDANGGRTPNAVTFEVSDESVASLDAQGRLISHKTGSFKLRALAGTLIAEKEMRVTEAPLSVALDKESYTLSVNGALQLNAHVNSQSASSFTWFTSDESIARVDDNGLVTGVGNGAAVISVKTYNGLTAACAVSVMSEPDDLILSATHIDVKEGQVAYLSASFTGDVYGDVYHEDLSGDGLVTIEQLPDGRFEIRGIYSGDVRTDFYVFNRTTNQSYYATLTVSVLPDITSIEFENPRQTLGLKETADLMPRAYDARGNLVEGTITLATSAKGYVSVSGSKVTGQYYGSATITARAQNGVEASIKVKTVKQPTSIALNHKTLGLSIGESAQLSYTLSSGSDSAISWTSSNPDVATVDADGKITALAQGSAVITASTYVKGKTASCTLTVSAAPEGIAFTQEALSLAENETAAAAVSFAPLGAGGTVTYWTDDPAVATVDANGQVRGVRYGSTVLNACVHSYADGSDYSAQMPVTVTPEAQSIVLGTQRRSVGRGETLDLAPVAYDRFGNVVNTSFAIKSASTYIIKTSGTTAIVGNVSGKTDITLTTANGVSLKTSFTAVPAPTKLVLSQASLSLAVGETAELEYRLTPANSVSAITWESDDTSVVTVEDGRLVAVGEGVAHVKCQSFVKNVNALCTVTVFRSPESIRFAADSISVDEGASVVLELIREPEGAGGTPEFSISFDGAEEIARLSGNRLQGLLSGSGTLSARIYNTVLGRYVECSVPFTVNPAPARIAFRSDRSSIGLHEYVDLKPIVYDARGNVIDSEVTLSAAATYIKIVDGLAYGNVRGSTNVTAKTANGVTLTVKYSVVAAPGSVRLSSTAISVAPGDSLQLSAHTSGSETADVAWSSSDESVARVDENGLVTGVSLGSAQVTCTTYNGKVASCTVNVVLAPEQILLEQSAYSVKEGESFTVRAALLPEGSAATLHYSIQPQDGSVASVNAQGVVTGVKSGEAILTVSAHDYEKNTDITAQATVTVEPAPVEIVTDARVEIGYLEIIDLAPRALDGSGNEIATSFRLTSSSARILKVEGTKVRGTYPGKATITVTAENGASTKITITVKSAPSKVTLGAAELTLQQGDTYTLSYAFNAGQEGAVTFESSDEAVAQVDENGVISAVGTGSASIKVTSYNGKSAKCVVTVKAAPQSVSFANDAMLIASGQSAVLSTAFEPADSWAKLQYSSSDPDVVSVDAVSGKITALKAGSATITASAVSNSCGPVSASVTVTTTNALSIVDCGCVDLVLGAGETVKLTPRAFDGEGNEVLTSFSVSTSSVYIAKVSGMSVQGVKGGNATITISTPNGAKCVLHVKVLSAPSKVSVSPSCTLAIGETAVLEATLPDKQASELSWTSDDPSIVTVDQTGTLRAVGKGTAKVHVKTFNNKTAACTVTVTSGADAIAFSQSVYTVAEGASLASSVSFAPAGSFGHPVYVFTPSGDAAIASVDAKGVLTGLLSGSGTLTASVYNDETGLTATASCQVEVVSAPVSIQLMQTRTKIGINETIDLEPVALDGRGNAVETTFTLKSSNIYQLQVNGTKVKGTRVSKPSVTVTAANGVSLNVKLEVAYAPGAIKLDESSFDLPLGGMRVIKTSITNVPDAHVTWTSSDPAVASVSENGTVTALGVGKATITATTYNKKKATATVNVKPEAEELSFAESEKLIGAGGSYTLKATIPEGTAANIVYASRNPYIARVNASTGRVDAIKPGRTSIVATIKTSSGAYHTASYAVVVRPAPVRIELTCERLTVGVGEKLDLKPVVYDENDQLTGSDYTYKAKSTYYLTVNADGVVTGKIAGSTDVTITAYNGVTLTKKITIVKAPTSVSLNAKNVTLGECGSFQLQHALNQGAVGACTYESSDSTVVTVDENGLIQAQSYGTAQITCRTYNGKTASCSVTVLYEPNGISLDVDTLEIGEGAHYQLKPAFSEYHYGEVNYASTNEEAATVDANGVLTALTAGETVISATTTNHKTGETFTDSVSVTVVPAPVEVRIINPRNTIGYLETVELLAEAYDANGNVVYGDFTVQVSNQNYIKLNGTALRGVRIGSATVTVTAYNGVKATRSFKVVSAPTGVKVSADTDKLVIGAGSLTARATLTLASSVSDIAWASEDESIATVDAAGRISAVSFGTTRIKASTYNGKNGFLTVHVFNAPAALTLVPEQATLGVGQGTELHYSFDENAYSTVTFSSDNESVATVGADGSVNAVGVGEAHITASAFNGVQDVTTVTVMAAPAWVQYNTSVISIGMGQSFDVSELVLLPEDSCTTLKFTVESGYVLTNVGNGVIKGKALGTTRVKVVTHNGQTALLTVKVLKAPDSFRLTCDTELVFVGDEIRFTAVYPTNSTGSAVFVSSNESILSIDADGAARALDAGQVTVTATSHNNKKATYSLTIYRHLDSMALTEHELTIVHYDSHRLSAVLSPADAYDTSLVWTSSDPETVSVSSDGTLTALKVSAAPVTITVTSNDMGFTDSCLVNVTPVRVTGLALSAESFTLERGRTHRLEALIAPANADDKTVTWFSSNPTVISVDGEGNVTAHTDSGSADITCTTTDGGFAQTITISAEKVHMQAAALGESSYTVTHYDTTQLSYSVTPEDADINFAVWSVADPSVISVDQNGVLSANNIGTTRVFVTITDSFGRELQCQAQVVVEPVHVSQLDLSASLLSIRVGAAKQLSVSVSPSNADDKSITWSAQPGGIVSIQTLNDGSVSLTGLKAGETLIRATSNDSGVIAECTVGVFEQLTVSADALLPVTTTGNDAVWLIDVQNAIGGVTYDIRVVSETGEMLNLSTYNVETGVVLPTPAVGTYTLSVSVTDGEGETAADSAVIEVSDRVSFTSGGVEWSYVITHAQGVTGASVKLVSCPAGLSSITVPAVMNGAPVVRIDTEAFMDRTQFTAVVLPTTVTEIGARAFKGCTSLKTVSYD